MRKTYLCLALLALFSPSWRSPRWTPEKGTLSVEDGRGKVNLQARGGVIGRIDRGTLTVYDTTPTDANFPVVTGADEPEFFVAGNGVRYKGAGIRFRVVGGGFKLVIQARGIDLSVVGRAPGLSRATRSSRASTRSTAPTAARTAPAATISPIRESASSSAHRRRAPRMASGAQTILVVEDEVSIASFVLLYL